MPINYYCDLEVQSNILTTDTSNSRVGVNIASPATTFHANGVVRAGGSNGGTYTEIGPDSIFFYNTGVYRGSIDLYPNSSSGNLYIGGADGSTVYFGAPSSWTTNIDVQGTIDCEQYLRIEDTNSSDRLVLRAESTYSTIDNSSNTLNYNAGNHLFLVGLSEKMRINSSGSVGIGTTNPLDKLHVNGTARANDYSVNGVASMFVYSNQLVITNSGNPLYLGGGPGSVAMNVLIPSGNLNVTGNTTTDNLNIGQNGTIDAENSSEILIGSGTEIQIDGDPGTSGQYLKSTGSAVEWATLPDTTTTQTIITSNFLDGGSTTSALRIPFNNLVETSSNQYYNCMDMPAAGTVKRFRMHNTSGTMSTGFTTTMSIFKNGSTTPTSSGALTASSGQIEWEPSNYTFSKGDHLQFAYAKSAGSKYWQGVSASIIIEFTKV